MHDPPKPSRLVELSTPFVNIHWFLNKTGRAGSTLQVANGVVLMVTFACCRLLWGAYMTVTFFSDVWTALQAPAPSSTLYHYSPREPPLLLQHRAAWWVAVAFIPLASLSVPVASAIWTIGGIVAAVLALRLLLRRSCPNAPVIHTLAGFQAKIVRQNVPRLPAMPITAATHTTKIKRK